jgi:hypothetical protein
VRHLALVMLSFAFLCAPAASAAPEPPRGHAPDRSLSAPNPCIGTKARRLLCPDLVMHRPFGLYAYGGLLHAGNAIVNAGWGPAELYGVRAGPRFMRARQIIYKRRGGRTYRRTRARLVFKYAHGGRRWWKWYNAARFELWRVDRRGRRLRRVRTGPKTAYCLRDLGHPAPGLAGSPFGPVYPACSTNAGATRARLGTSVGWADVYPPSYPEQWINAAGLRGCFAYVHTADPRNRIYESNEDNNEAQVVVRLPLNPYNWRAGCKGRGTALRDRDPNRY